MACDVTEEAQIVALVEATEAQARAYRCVLLQRWAQGEVACLLTLKTMFGSRQWELHVMAHVYAARAVLPGMIERGSGYLMNTASAAGLLAALGSGPYTVTKAAAVKLAEFLRLPTAMKASSICTLRSRAEYGDGAAQPGDGQTDGIIEPSALADTVVEAMREERFHVLTPPEGRRICAP